MIHCVVGFPGTGKTTYCARLAHRAMKHGVKVYSNIPELTKTIPVSLSDFGRYNIHDGLLIFDEAGIEMNSRSWKGFPMEAVRFLKLHRHYHMEIWIFSQAEDYDVTVRRLAERIYIIRKSRIRAFSSLQRLHPEWVVDDLSGQPRVQWVMMPWWSGGVKWIFRPKWYKHFDSWSAPQLPPLPAEIDRSPAS